jgi:hypothetical protein
MAAAHFGSAIEALQKAFFKAHESVANNRILQDDGVWRELCRSISACISDARLSSEEETILINKVQNLNLAPQGVIMKRFFNAVGLEIGALEGDVWANRNRAAHGGGADSDNALRLVRENKVLHIMMNRILIALGHGGDSYYDYYNFGRPTMRLAEPVRDDRLDAPVQ